MRLPALAAVVLACLVAHSVPAAIVTYDMDLSVPGEFKIFASASVDDNFGLATYVLPLTAQTTSMLTSFEHVSPFANMATDAGGALGPAGFNVLRSTYIGLGGGMTFFASQDVIGGTPHLIHGFGQQAGSFADLGITPLSPDTPTTWGDSMLIAQGTYVGNANDFSIDTTSADLVANVFTEGHAIQAEMHVFGTNGFSYIPQPEPPPLANPEPPPPAPVAPPPPPQPQPVEPVVTDPAPENDPPPIEPPTQPEPSEPASGNSDPTVWVPGETRHLPSWEGIPEFEYVPPIEWRGEIIGVVYYDGLTFTTDSQPNATLFAAATNWSTAQEAAGVRNATLSGPSFFGAGQDAAAAAQAPEPTSALMAGLAVATLFTRARRRRHASGRSHSTQTAAPQFCRALIHRR